MPISLSGSLNLSGSLTTTGTITATTLVVQTITSSISSITGSTNFGSLAANTHTFTGSLLVSGSNVLIGTPTSNGFRFKVSNNGAEEIAINPGDSANLNNYVNYNRSTSTYIAANYLAATHSFLNGNVGIGMTPDVPLQVKAASGTVTAVRIGPSASGFELSQENAGYTVCTVKNIYSTTNNTAELSLQSGFITFKTDTTLTERIRITSGGNLLFTGGVSTGVTDTKFLMISQGTTSSTFAMVVKQSNNSTNLFLLRDDGLIQTGTASGSPYNNTSGAAANVVVTSAGTLERSTSSLKYKKEVRDYDKGLAEVMQMRPVYYKGKSESNGDKQYAGLIAEEINELGLDEFVVYAEDGSPDALAYQNMVSLLVKAIQELTARVQYLENK